MQRSAVFNMPMAIVVAKSWNKYLELPTKYKALCLGPGKEGVRSLVIGSLLAQLRMYWWTPDDSFLDIGPQPLIFPPRDPVAQSRGDWTTSIEKTEIAKVVSADLESMAPDLVQLFHSSQCLGRGRSCVAMPTSCSQVTRDSVLSQLCCHKSSWSGFSWRRSMR